VSRYIKPRELKKIIKRTFPWPHERIGLSWQLGDRKYYCAHIDAIHRVIKETKSWEFRWTEERFDCDDFAYFLKAGFCKAGYKNNRRSAAYAAGILWGVLGGSKHAINFAIDHEKQLWLIEPQRRLPRCIFKRRKSDKRIFLVVA
jgi:hypothetical protein